MYCFPATPEQSIINYIKLELHFDVDVLWTFKRQSIIGIKIIILPTINELRLNMKLT